jgi:hypothetical protein
MPGHCPGALLTSPIRSLLVLSIPVIAALAVSVSAQSYPNPYATVDGWLSLPGGRTMGAVGDIDVDPDGEHIWAVVRCDATAPDRFGDECLDSDLDSILKIDSEGNVVESFGGGMFIWPHGIDADDEGNVWVTDAVADGRIPDGDRRGHQVVKFSPTGEILMVLGSPGEQGVAPNHFTSPADVVVGDDGNVFVADGHYESSNSRVVKFDRAGNFIKAWGQTGYAPGRWESALAMPLRAGSITSCSCPTATSGIRLATGRSLSQSTQPAICTEANLGHGCYRNTCA